jgi:hypothetical protein
MRSPRRMNPTWTSTSPSSAKPTPSRPRDAGRRYRQVTTFAPCSSYTGKRNCTAGHRTASVRRVARSRMCAISSGGS